MWEQHRGTSPRVGWGELRGEGGTSHCGWGVFVLLCSTAWDPTNYAGQGRTIEHAACCPLRFPVAYHVMSCHAVCYVVQGAINYTVALVRGRLSTARTRLGLLVSAPVSRCHIRWLGLSAARKVLGR